LQDRDEAGPPVPIILGGEVRSPEKHLALGCEERGERPTALAGERLHRALVARVHVGPLVAVDFDAHEVAVQELGDLGTPAPPSGSAAPPRSPALLRRCRRSGCDAVTPACPAAPSRRTRTCRAPSRERTTCPPPPWFGYRRSPAPARRCPARRLS